MKTLFLTALALATQLPFAHADEAGLAGIWVDVDLEQNLTALERSGDKTAFCSGVYYQGEHIDAMLDFTADGKILLCKLNQSQLAPVGKNCSSFGEYTGNALTLTYDDGSQQSGQATPAADGSLHVEIRHTRIGKIEPVETWELKRLSPERADRLAGAVLSCMFEKPSR